LFMNKKDDQGLFVHCDFGVVPPELGMQVYRTLLIANLSIHGTGSAFIVSPITGRVILANHYLVRFLTPPLLAGFLSVLAQHALAWREGYFLEGKPGRAAGKHIKYVARLPFI
jgi:Tir chaperone protein (CesT) family